MCIRVNTPKPPDPPPLAPADPPPAPPKDPLPESTPLEADVNPAVRRAKSQKKQSTQAKGTQSLRIPLDPDINTGAKGPAGGVQ